MTQSHRKPRIALPMPTSHDDAYNERCWPEYAAAIEAVGGDPVRILLGLDPAATAKLVSGCDAVLLPGSPADVHPQKYGQESKPETAAPDFKREATDELILQDAFHIRKHVLAVCFGLQIMNIWRGGTLEQHLGEGHQPPEGASTLTHRLQVEPDTLLMRRFYLDLECPEVNSKHHQAVAVPGDGLRVAARSQEDGVIEALEGTELNSHFVLGVQWHPERSYTTDAPSRALFTAFVAAAHQWQLPSA